MHPGELIFHFLNTVVLTALVASVVLWRYRVDVLAGMGSSSGQALSLPAVGPARTVMPQPAAAGLAWEKQARRRIALAYLGSVAVPAVGLAVLQLHVGKLPQTPAHVMLVGGSLLLAAVPMIAVSLALRFWQAVRLGLGVLMVCAVFGTGLTREVSGAWAGVIAAMNEVPAPKVALDLPSGVDADTGAVLGAAVEAVTTITFAGHKRGLAQQPGRAHAGRVWVADIGVPVGRDGPDALLEPHDLRTLVPRRASDAHKGSAGHVAVVGGDAGKTGAAFLAGLGALRGGAGLVTLVAPEAGRAVLEHKTVEMMTAALPGAQGRESEKSGEQPEGPVVGEEGHGYLSVNKRVQAG